MLWNSRSNVNLTLLCMHFICLFDFGVQTVTKWQISKANEFKELEIGLHLWIMRLHKMMNADELVWVRHKYVLCLLIKCIQCWVLHGFTGSTAFLSTDNWIITQIVYTMSAVFICIQQPLSFQWILFGIWISEKHCYNQLHVKTICVLGLNS